MLASGTIIRMPLSSVSKRRTTVNEIRVNLLLNGVEQMVRITERASVRFAFTILTPQLTYQQGVLYITSQRLVIFRALLVSSHC